MNQLVLSNSSKTIAPQDIGYESLKVIESISSKKLNFGACETTSITLRIRSSVSVLGEVFKVTLTRGDQTDEWDNMTVVSDTPTADKSYRDIELRDAMDTIAKTNVASWYDTLLPTAQSACTLHQMRDSLFSYLGIEQVDATLPNDGFIVRKTIDADEITGKKVLTAICQLNGCFGHIDRDGKFRYVFIENTSGATITQAETMAIKYEAFTTDAITKVQIRETENDIGGSYGTGTNVLIIEDNFLAYGCSTSELEVAAYDILKVVQNVRYTPVNIKTPYKAIALGQKFGVVTKYGTIYSYNLKSTISGILFVKENLVSNGTKALADKPTTTQDELIKMRGKTNELTRTVEGTESKITELAAATTGTAPNSLQSQINQYAGQINLKVSQETFNSTVDDLQRQLDNASQNYNVNYVPTLDNYPAYDWAVSPIIDVSPFDADGEIPWIYTEEEYAKHARTSCFDETTGITYRFGRNSDGTWGWAEEASPEYSSVMRRLSEIEIDVEGITSKVETEYLTIDAASGTYATQSQLSSQIQQTATGITQSVSETYQTKSAAEAAAATANKYADTVGQNVLQSAESKIEQTSQSITSSVSATYMTKSAGDSNLNTAKQYADSVGASTLQTANSNVTQTANNILSTVSETYVKNTTRNSDLETLNTSINQTATAITNEAKRASEAEGNLSASLKIAADGIDAEITRATSAEGSLSARISANATSISSKVSAGSVISEINQSAESVTISAGKINLNGVVNSTEFTSKYATISSLNAVDGKFNNLNASNITSGTLSASRIDISGLVNAEEFTSKYATISSLNAVNGKFENLNASNITTGTLSVARMDVDNLVTNAKFTAKYATVSSLNALKATVNTINANYITASYINATNISAALNSPWQGSITVGSVRAQSWYYHDGYSYNAMRLIGLTINGNDYHLLGYTG